MRHSAGVGQWGLHIGIIDHFLHTETRSVGSVWALIAGWGCKSWCSTVRGRAPVPPCSWRSSSVKWRHDGHRRHWMKPWMPALSNMNTVVSSRRVGYGIMGGETRET